MKFCSQCGQNVVFKIPAGDNRERYVCEACDVVYYFNPRVITGCLVVKDDKVLLCKRDIEPRFGLWTLPGGFMENGETTCSAALRETREEACAEVTPLGLYAIINAHHINQVHVFYLADLGNATFAAGDETSETKLFAVDDIPWNQLAFGTVYVMLKNYVDDFKQGVAGYPYEFSMNPPKKS